MARITDPRKLRRLAWRALKLNAHLTKKYDRFDPETKAMRVAVIKAVRRVTKRSLARVLEVQS